MMRFTLHWVLGSVLVGGVPLWAAQGNDAPQESETLRHAAKAFTAPLPAVPATRLDDADVQLGRALFWDPRLSAGGKTACASCHLAEDWGGDRNRFSLDARGKSTKRNSQSIFNAVLQPRLRWLADRASGAQQAEGSLTGSMGFQSTDEAVELFKKLGYEQAFAAAFPNASEPVSASHYGQAIQAYESTLVTPSPLDRFLSGEDDAISERAKAGLARFISSGCSDCHNGRSLGGERLETFGVVKPYWTATGSEKQDAGLFGVTGEETDRYKFRVSMLRNIAKTAPYFHDGSVQQLDDAVRVMAEVQLGLLLSDTEVADIVAFLETLSGEVPSHYAPPEE